ncbi:MAG: RidA family protein [Hyphomicrobiaceae bacterium]
MQKRHAWPRDHWSWPIKVTHKHGVRAGQMLWVGGQVDLDPAGEVCNPGNLAIQTRNAMCNLTRVLAELDAQPQDLVKLNCFYVNDGRLDENVFLGHVAAGLPRGARPAVTAVPVPYLAYPGMVAEIEAIAMRGMDGRPLSRTYASGEGASPLPPPFAHAVRCGKMIFVSAQAPLDPKGAVVAPGKIIDQTKLVMNQIGRVLGDFGAGFGDVVKQNRWYVGHGTVEDFEPAALACAAHYAEPGPAATGVPIPRHAQDGMQIKVDVVAMLGEDGRHLPRRHVWPDSLWDWTMHLPYKHGLKCHDMIFLGGQVSLDKQGRAVNPGQMTKQTHQAMQHIGTILRELGAGYGDVCKVLTVYESGAGYRELHENLSIRSSYFPDPGPATTGVPLPKLAYPQMMIEIDIYAMAEPDETA